MCCLFVVPLLSLLELDKCETSKHKSTLLDRDSSQGREGKNDDQPYLTQRDPCDVVCYRSYWIECRTSDVVNASCGNCRA